MLWFWKIRNARLSSLPRILFKEQAFYGKPRNPGCKRPFSFSQENMPAQSTFINTGKNGLDELGPPRLCHNCQSPSQLIRECRKRREKEQIVNNFAKMLQRNLLYSKQILYELCAQIEDIFNPESSSIADPFLDDEGVREADIGDTVVEKSDENSHETINGDFIQAERDLSDPDIFYSEFTKITSSPIKFYSPCIVRSPATAFSPPPATLQISRINRTQKTSGSPSKALALIAKHRRQWLVSTGLERTANQRASLSQQERTATGILLALQSKSPSVLFLFEFPHLVVLLLSTSMLFKLTSCYFLVSTLLISLVFTTFI